MKNRRGFLSSVLGMGAGLAAMPRAWAARPASKARTSASIPVQTPDIPQLPFRMDGGVKEFHLVAEPVKQELIPGKVVDLWGYNGSAPGPTIQVNQGDRGRIIVDNHLPEPTSMHWHGFEIPHSMDGGPGVSQEPIKPGG